VATLKAGNWEWYYPDQSDTGESIASIVGYSKPAVAGLMRYSTAMRNDARAILSMHEDQGHSRIDVLHKGEAEEGHKAKLDSVVYLIDEGDSTNKGGKLRQQWRSVKSIEFGHYNKPREHEGEGPRTKKDHRRSFVPGIAPLRTAAKRARAKRRLSI
jgi:hypothetical protein